MDNLMMTCLYSTLYNIRDFFFNLGKIVDFGQGVLQFHLVVIFVELYKTPWVNFLIP